MAVLCNLARPLSNISPSILTYMYLVLQYVWSMNAAVLAYERGRVSFHVS